MTTRTQSDQSYLQWLDIIHRAFINGVPYNTKLVRNSRPAGIGNLKYSIVISNYKAENAPTMEDVERVKNAINAHNKELKNRREQKKSQAKPSPKANAKAEVEQAAVQIIQTHPVSLSMFSDKALLEELLSRKNPKIKVMQEVYVKCAFNRYKKVWKEITKE